MAGDERRRSGERYLTPLPSTQSQQFVTLEHFNGFTEECRGFFVDMRTQMGSIEKEMGKGSTRFALMDQELKRQAKRGDDHSGKIQTLIDDKIGREAVDEQVEAQQKPRRDIWFELIKTIIIAIVLGIGAVIYNSWRDQEVSRAIRESPTPVTTNNSVPAKPIPNLSTP